MAVDLNLSSIVNASSIGVDVSKSIAGNYWFVLAGIALLVLAFILFSMLKQIIVNSVVGLIALAALKYVLGIDIPLNIAVVASVALFGLAGLGMLLILMFFGVKVA
jgi:hypothetical protein